MIENTFLHAKKPLLPGRVLQGNPVVSPARPPGVIVTWGIKKRTWVLDGKYKICGGLLRCYWLSYFGSLQNITTGVSVVTLCSHTSLQGLLTSTVLWCLKCWTKTWEVKLLVSQWTIKLVELSWANCSHWEIHQFLVSGWVWFKTNWFK